MRKAIAFLTVFVLSISLFAQTDVAKYGDKGAPPEVRIPQTWHSNNNRTEDFTVVLFDSYGDGWGWAGSFNSLTVAVNGTAVLTDITMDGGSASDPFPFAVDNDDIVQITFNENASYASENSYAVYDHLGNSVASAGPEDLTFTVEITADIPGCMTAAACNYDADATADDGSCCVTNCTTISAGGGTYDSEITWEITNELGDVLPSGAAPYSDFACLDDGDYTATGWDSYGDGWNGALLTVTDDDGTVYLSWEGPGAELAGGESASVTFTVGALPPPPAPAVFFSEYAEGSSNNKYFEIYNGTGSAVDLADYLVLGNYNGNPFNDTLRFPAGTALSDGDVFIVAHEGASAGITAIADSLIEDPFANGTSYIAVFNGDDVRALVHMSGTDSTIIDIIGTLEGGDPGSGWDVAGTINATKDHTLVRKDAVMEGNGGDWATSAGTTDEDSEWIVADKPTADYLPPTIGWHINDPTCYANLVSVNMFDAYGDGWNGNVLTIYTDSLTVTAEDGDYASAELCLNDGSYTVSCDGGSYQSEVSWVMYDAAGDTLLAGGAPYSGVLQLGETTDVFGCMDPAALNYDITATADDGSCYYSGDSCSIALAAIAGTNDASGADQWFNYTATLTGTMTVSSAGAGADTKVDIYSDCDGALIDSDDDGLGYPPGESELTINVVTGTSYNIMWDGVYAPGPFSWTLEEALLSSSPENLTTTAGVESVSLEWDGVMPGSNRSMAYVKERILTPEDAKAIHVAKMVELKGNEPLEVHTFGVVNSDYVSNSRSTDVIIECDGGSWQSEVSWEILDAAGTVVAEGGAPSGQLAASLDNGEYTVNGYDAYGDGWNGNVLTVTGATDGVTWLSFTLADGDFATANFTMSDTPPELANLNMSDLHYDIEEDAVMLTLHNTGGSTAYGFYINYYRSNETSGECQNDLWDDWDYVDFLEPDSSFTYAVLEDASYWMGYDTFNIGAFIDWECTVPETDEEDNTITTTVEIVDPFDGVTWNIYRSDAGAEFAYIMTSVHMEYLDEGLTGDVEYCYYVTQRNTEFVESDSSNHACATALGPVDTPAPTALTAESDGWSVMVNWVAPDIGGGGGATEDFEGGSLPAGWDMTTNASACAELEPGWFITENGTSAYWDVPAGDGYYAVSNDDACNSDGSLDYLHVPSQDFTNGGLSLNFTSYFSGAYSQTGHILVSVDGGGSYTEVYAVAPGTDWVNESVDLSAYGGESDVRVIFWANDNEVWASGWAVDNISFSSPADFTFINYNVYRNAELVGSTASLDATSFDEFITEEGDYVYYVTAFYDVFGESDPSNSDTVTVEAPAPTCNAPQNLVAESLGNDVSLSWDAPAGGAGWFGHNDGMLATSIGTGGEATFSVAARFGQEELQNYNGMALSKVRFVHNEPAASYQIAVWTAEPGGVPVLVDMSEWMSGGDIPAGDWYEYELDESIAIDWTQELWFGYNIETPSGYPAGCDAGPAVAGYGDLLNFGGDFISMSDAYGLNYNWLLDGFANYGDGRSISSMAPIAVEYQNLNTTTEPSERRLPRPIVINTTSDRDMINYIVYRDGEAEDTLGIGENTYNDIDVEWGDHNYYVTALYNNSEECGESVPSNTADVSLVNHAPPPVMILQPDDGATIVVTSSNTGNDFPFIWTGVNDEDNDPVMYVVLTTDETGAMVDTGMAVAGWFPTIGELAAPLLEDSVSSMTYSWNVWSHDPWDSTASMNGPRSLTIDVSGLLALDGIGLPEVFALHNNYPNPFNPVTNITYDIPEVAQVTLDIYNVSGQKVRTLAQGQHEPGRYRVQWNATNDFGSPLSSGMYIYRIHAGDFVSVKKLILMK